MATWLLLIALAVLGGGLLVWALYRRGRGGPTDGDDGPGSPSTDADVAADTAPPPAAAGSDDATVAAGPDTAPPSPAAGPDGATVAAAQATPSPVEPGPTSGPMVEPGPTGGPEVEEEPRQPPSGAWPPSGA